MTTSHVARKLFLPAALAMLLTAIQALSPIAAATTPDRKPEADKLHVVLLVYSSPSEIADADTKDVLAMQQTIELAFAEDSDRVVFHDLTGKNPKTDQWYTEFEILDYLKEMKIGPNDNVLVYHSGHGAIANPRQPEASQILEVNGGRFKRGDAMRAVMALQPRALIMLTDCCSSYLGTAYEAPEAGELNIETVRFLMLTPRGIISLTAAEDGRTAKASFVGTNPGNAGSAFTVAFLRLCYKDDVTYTSWESMFPVLRHETYNASGGVHTARAFQIAQ